MKFRALLIVAISFLLLTFNLGSWGITETSESRYAEISREMLVNNDYVHPKLLGIHHYHKPPITYQITTLGYKIFGVNEFGARFFLQIAIIIQLLLVYHIALLLFNKKSMAFTSMLIYFSLPIVLISSRNLTTDAYLTTTVLASVFFWLYYKLKGLKPIYIYLFFLMLGLSFEIKGPVGLLFPLVFIICYKVVLKDKFKITFHHVLGVLLFLVVSFMWYIVVFIENPILYNYFFKEQIVNRISAKSYNRSKPFWFYIATVPAIGLPWIFFIIHQCIKKFKTIKSERSYAFILLISTSIILVLFSIFKTKLILYVLPSFGFIAILAAKLLSNTSENLLKKYQNIIIGFTLLIAVAFLVVVMLDIDFKFQLFTAIIILIIAATSITYIIKHKTLSNYIKTGYLGFVFGAIILISGTQFLKLNDAQLNSTKKVFEFVNNELPNKQNIVVYNYLLASAQFYSDKNVITLNDGHNTVQRETQFETNDQWKDYNLNLSTEGGKKQAKQVLEHNAVLITRKKRDLPDYYSYLRQPLPHRKEIGTWVIYY